MSQFFLRLNKKGCGWTTSCLFGGGFSEAIRPQKSGFLIHSTEYSNTVVQKQRRECERDVSAFANPSLLLHIGSIAFFLIHLLLQESIRSSEHDDSTLPFGPFCVRQYDARCSWQSTVRLAEVYTHPVHIWMKFCKPPLQGLSNHHKNQPQKRRAKRAVAAKPAAVGKGLRPVLAANETSRKQNACRVTQKGVFTTTKWPTKGEHV